MTFACAYQTCRLSLKAHIACSRRAMSRRLRASYGKGSDQGRVRPPGEAYLSLRLAGCCHGRSRLLLEHKLARLELLLLHRPCHCTGICKQLAPTDNYATWTWKKEFGRHERHTRHPHAQPLALHIGRRCCKHRGLRQEEVACLKVRLQGGGDSLSSGSAGARVLLRSAA